MRLWKMGMGLLLIGLLAPIYAGITGPIAPLFSDPFDSILIYSGMAIILFVFVFLMLWSRM